MIFLDQGFWRMKTEVYVGTKCYDSSYGILISSTKAALLSAESYSWLAGIWLNIAKVNFYLEAVQDLYGSYHNTIWPTSIFFLLLCHPQ